ncbi:MAG: ABC transporter substrate-binding protein [Lachnospiraceae bacterium]
MPQMVFEYILKQHGLTPGKDLIVDQSIDFGSTAAAFLSGSGDYTVEFEPFATGIEDQKGGYVVASLGSDSGYIPYTSFCARKSYLAENEKTIQSFTNALQKGMDFVKTHSPKEIAAIIKPQFKDTSPETITTIVKRYQDQQTWNSDLIYDEESYTLLCNILEEAGTIKSRPPYETLIHTIFAQKAVGKQ